MREKKIPKFILANFYLEYLSKSNAPMISEMSEPLGITGKD
jgi:hypothetical protein